MSQASEGSPGPAAVGGADGYEFTPEQNRLIARLASRMQVVGVFALVLGVAAVVAGGFRGDPGALVGGTLFAMIGLWTERAGRAFRLIARTEGQDIGHLMHALIDLRRLYTLQYWVCFLALLAALILLGATVAGAVG